MPICETICSWAPSSERPVFQIDTTTNYSTSDYNGFGANAGANNFAWNSPPDGMAADYDYTHKLTVRRFPDPEGLCRRHGTRPPQRDGGL